MAIRPNAFDAHFCTRPHERELAERLHESFDVTFARESLRLSYWFAQPHAATAERFGLQQELLVVYCPHAAPDARILNLIEGVLREPENRHRLDRTLCLLIHHGNESRVEELLSTYIDRLVVPFRSDELLDKARGSLFIRTRIARTIGQIDLFGMSSPITADQYFFGRNEIVQELVRRSTSQCQNTGLFGLRRTGKTSVLRAVERRLDGLPVVIDYMDCSNPGVHIARWWQVLEEIARRLTENLTGRSGVRQIPPGSYERETAGTRFLRDIEQVIERSGGSSILIMLDEIEYITSGLSRGLGRHWDDDYVPFWQAIRSTHQETGNQMMFIVAGVNPACVNQPHFSGLTNPIFEIASLKYLEPFDRDQVRSMVRSIGRYSGLDFSEDVYGYLQDVYGGHPFLIRIACSEVWQTVDTIDAQKRVGVGVDRFVRLQDQIKARLAQPIKDILLSLLWWYPDEYDILEILANGDADFVEEYVAHNPGSVIQFGRYGILKPGVRGEFAIRDLREFLILNGSTYRQEVSPFRSGDFPAELLPEVPDLEQLTRLFKLRTEVELKLRRAILVFMQVEFHFDVVKISNALGSAIKPRKDRRDPHSLFVGRPPRDAINELYTIDLKDIVLFHWSMFAVLFKGDKDRFAQQMDTLNTARRVDAHAKPFTEQQAQTFLSSYAWLMDCLSKVE